MDHLNLNISRLVLKLDLSKLRPGLINAMAETFSPFLQNGNHIPHETLDVVPLPLRIGNKPNKDLGLCVRASIRYPLTKFPFTPDLEEDVDRLMECFRPLLRYSCAEAFVDGSAKPENVAFYLLSRGFLARKETPPQTSLFLKPGVRDYPKLCSLYEGVYFTTAMALPSMNACMLHGVGIRREGQGLLFLGLSGSGKTTVASFSTAGEIISDDAVVVERQEDHYFLRPTPFDQTPFAGEHGNGGNTAPNRLKAAFFLHKDDSVRVEEISPAEACSKILTNYIHFFRYLPNRAVVKAFGLVTGLCKNIPFYRLHFKRDPSFWPVVEGMMREIS